jgi:hypothetical protein
VAPSCRRKNVFHVRNQLHGPGPIGLYN